MGYPDRLREEGYSEDEIAEMQADGKKVERPQNPETARVSHDTEPYTGIPYEAPPAGDAGYVPEGLAEPSAVASDEVDEDEVSLDDED